MIQTREYAGIISIDEMKEQRTIRIAGSDDHAGELIYLDSRIWQIDDEGVATEPSGDTGICLGSTTTFEPTISYSFDQEMEDEDFIARVNNLVPNHDLPYGWMEPVPGYRYEAFLSRRNHIPYSLWQSKIRPYFILPMQRER